MFVCGIVPYGLPQSMVLQNLAQPFSLTVTLPIDSPPPLAGENWGDFSVLKVETSGQRRDEANKDYSILIVAYDTGTFVLPLPANIASETISQIKILAPTEEEIKAYAPIKELDFTPEKTPLWRWIAFIAGILIIAYLLWYLWKNQNRTIQVETKNKADAISMLLGIKNDWEHDALNSKQLGDGLINSLRICYKVNTKRSSRQLLLAIQKEIGGAIESNFANTLQDCDAWRFGKKDAKKEVGFMAIESIENILRQINPGKETATNS